MMFDQELHKKKDILVFRTSLQTKAEVRFLANTLNSHEGISEWSVDLEDWEKILRIESSGILPDEVAAILENNQIMCRQL